MTRRFGGRHAIVMGGSVAGLVAARVLADHFDQVTVLERDPLPAGPEHRKGVPQGRHNHVLLLKGQQLLEQLFPGLLADLQESGAVVADSAADLLWHHCGVYKQRVQTGVSLSFMSRPLLEWQLRRHLLGSRNNVRLMDGCGANRLLVDRGSGRIIGVQFSRAEAEAEEQLTADLVVDATGRGSRSPQWLTALGYPSAPVSEVKVNVHYATRVYRVPTHPPDFKACILSSDPPQVRAGVLFPLEGGQWIVGMQGYFGDRPPTDEAGFLEFARKLPTPAIYEAIREAEPVSEIIPGGAPSSLRRHYERMDRFPEGYVILGDAVCSFNPVYAQGMTVAALGAESLNACLQEQARTAPGQIAGLSRRFQQALAKAVEGPWQAATGGDFAYPQTEGVRPPGTAVMTWYMRRIARLCGKDPDVMRRFVKVMHLVEPPTLLFNLRTVLRAFLAG